MQAHGHVLGVTTSQTQTRISGADMIRLVVFDAYGTLFDVYSVSALAERLFPGQGQALSVLWRDKQIEYSRLISLSDPLNPMGSRHYQPFWDLTRLATPEPGTHACQTKTIDGPVRAFGGFSRKCGGA